MNSGQPTKGEWRVVWADGSVHWIAGRWQVFMDASGEPSKMIGVNISMLTEHKRAEEAIQKKAKCVFAGSSRPQTKEYGSSILNFTL